MKQSPLPQRATCTKTSHDITAAWTAYARTFTLTCALIVLLCGSPLYGYAAENNADAEASQTNTTNSTPQTNVDNNAATETAKADEAAKSDAAQSDTAESGSTGSDTTDTNDPDDTDAHDVSSVDTDPENIVDPAQRADNSFIYDTSIGAIAGQSSLYDKRIVQIEGEVIGDRISADPGNCWIMLSSIDDDDASSISVYMSSDQADQIDRFGRYGVTGTTLQVRGEYHQACNEHEGLADIHATNSSVVSIGEDHPDAFNPNDFIPGIIVIVIGAALLFVFRVIRERMR